MPKQIGRQSELARWSLLAVAAFVTACGDSEPAPVDLCEPPPPENCTIDPTQFPTFNGTDTIEINRASDLEPFCEERCSRVDAVIRLNIQKGGVPSSLAPLSNLEYVDGIRVYPDGFGGYDFRGLENLKETRYIWIESEGSIESLRGFDGLEQIGVLVLRNLPNLESLEGLSSLQTIDDEAYYDDVSGISSTVWRTGLTDFTGLESLTRVNALFPIRENSQLKSLDGMEGLTEVRRLQVYENPSLESVEGLSSLERVNTISFGENPKLPECRVEELFEGLMVQGDPRIEPQDWTFNEDNNPECPDEP